MTGFADIIEERHRGAVRSILNAKERIADPHLTRQDSDRLRKIIVDELAALSRLAVNLVSTVDGHMRDGLAMNQLWLEQIAEAVGLDPETVTSNGHDHAGG